MLPGGPNPSKHQLALIAARVDMSRLRQVYASDKAFFSRLAVISDGNHAEGIGFGMSCKNLFCIAMPQIPNKAGEWTLFCWVETTRAPGNRLVVQSFARKLGYAQ